MCPKSEFLGRVPVNRLMPMDGYTCIRLKSHALWEEVREQRPTLLRL